MLKKILTHSAALVVLLSTSVVPAHAAGSASTAITINGSVADTCTMALAAASTAATNASYATNVITITALANATTAVSTDAGTTLEFNGMCNYAHNISIGSTNGGLDYQGTVTVVGGDFDDLVEYDVSLTWGGSTVTLDADGSAVIETASISGANAQDNVSVVFDFDNNNGTDPLLSGAYTDTITLKLGATI